MFVDPVYFFSAKIAINNANVFLERRKIELAGDNLLFLKCCKTSQGLLQSLFAFYSPNSLVSDALEGWSGPDPSRVTGH